MKSGNLNFLEASGPLQACKGTALSLPLPQLKGVFINLPLAKLMYETTYITVTY
jgi:hypothetical protein